MRMTRILLLAFAALIIGPIACSRRGRVAEEPSNKDDGTSSVAATRDVADEANAAANEIASLQGEWLLISGSSFGAPVPGGGPPVRLIVKGDEIVTASEGEQIAKERFTLDPSKRPKWIDLESFTTSPRKYINHAIYELDEDTFTLGLSSAAVSADRPSTFPRGDGVLLIYKRQKPGER